MARSKLDDLLVINTGVTPQLKTANSRGWINYDVDNLLPIKILKLYESAPTHAAVVNKKADYTAARDITPTNPAAGEFTRELDEGGGIRELVYKCALDYFLYGGYSIQVLWDSALGYVYTAIHQPFEQVRIRYNRQEQKQTGVYVCPDWLRNYTYSPKEFNFFRAIETASEPVFMYSKRYTAGNVFYPLPDWWSGLRSISNEVELINVRYFGLKNIFAPSGVLKLPAGLPDSAKEELRRKVEYDMKGSENTGKIITVFSDNEKAIDYKPFPTYGLDRVTRDLSDQTAQEILVAHQIPSPLLVGIPTPSGFNSEAAMLGVAAREFFDKTIAPVQNKILNDLSIIYKAAGYPTEWDVLQSYINVKPE